MAKKSPSHTLKCPRGPKHMITRRRGPGSQASAEEERLKFVLNNSIDAAYQRNLQTDRYDYLSPVIERLTGYTVEEMTALSIDSVIDLIHPDDLQSVQREIELTSAGKKDVGTLEYRLLSKTGEYVWLADRFSLIRDNQNRPLYRVGIVRDITDRKKAEAALRESEHRFASFMDNSPAIAWIKDEQGRHVYLNAMYENTFGVRLSDWLGKTDHEKWPQEIAEQFRQNDQQVISEGRPFQFIEETIDAKGNRRCWLNTKFPIVDAKGRYVAGIGIDITEIKETERKLRENEHFLARAQQIVHVGHWERRFPSQEVQWSDETYRIFGLQPQECPVGGRFFFDRIHPEDLSRVEKAVQDAVDDIRAYDELFRIVRPDGSVRWVHSKGEVDRGKDGATNSLFGIMLDITERKRMEEQLRSSEETVRAILNAPDEIICLIDSAGVILEANAEAQRRLGDKIVGRSIHDLVTLGEVVQARKARLEQVVRTGRQISFEDERIGTHFHTVLYPVCNEAGRVTEVVVYAADITERKQMEKELRRSRDELEVRVKERTAEVAQLAAAVENAIDGIALCEGYGIVYANRAFSRITGYPLEELIGKDVAMLRSQARPDSFYEEMKESLAKRRMWTEVYPGQKKDGTPIYVETHASLIRDTSTLIVICHDITDKLRLEEELRQAHKMEAVGTLAGGIAHDFNNILAAVLGFSEIALEDTEQPHVEDSLKHVISAALRGRDLVRQILTFSRKSTGEKKIVDLAPVIKETFNMLRAALPSTINMELSMKAESYTARADIGGIPQIVMNICTNAAQAMPNGGDLGLSVTETKFTARRMLPDPELKAGHYLVLSFTDNGTGMDKTVLSRVFEPFFTTKTSGQGTGMGLAVAYGIAKEHGGTITVESAPGKGSTFVVYLPLIHDTAKEEAPSVQPAVTGGHERVLFVDDEENIAAIAQQMLTRLGYKVVIVDRPEHALELFRADPHAFDLVITDQTMPNFTGLSLAKKLLALRADLPIILATGYSEAASAEKARKAGIREFLMKPMQKREWAETIRRVLDSQNSASF